MDFDEISENFEFLDDWEDRYRYLIELGESLDPLPESERTAQNKVSGCMSQVWLVSQKSEKEGQAVLHFRGDSDAMIVKGLVGVLIAFYSGKPADWISQTDAMEMFSNLGLSEHLTSQRSNGLKSMIERIRREARAVL